MISPFVSVVMPVFNQQNYLRESIESVLNQTYKNFEFIIVDDGSTDKSREIINSYARKDERIIALFQENQGKPNAINNGVAVSNGNLIAFIDHDDTMLPERLKKQVNYISTYSEIDAVSCHCNYINKLGTIIGTQKYYYLESVDDCKFAIENKIHVMCSFTGLMVAKEAYVVSGGLRDKFWPCDDLEFINRMIDSGFLLVIIPEILMNYRIHPSSTTAKKQWYLFKVAEFTNLCISLRRSNQKEISFDEFIVQKNKESWWEKYKKNSHNYSIIFLQKANFSLYTKRYLKFIMYFTSAFILDNKYVLIGVQKRLNQKNQSKMKGFNSQ